MSLPTLSMSRPHSKASRATPPPSSRRLRCPSCGERSDIFGHGGARKEAERLGVPFLGEVPLHMAIREKSDSGLPVVATEPDAQTADS